MLDAIQSHCSSAAMCHTVTTYNSTLVGMLNLYSHTTTISPSDVVGQRDEIEGIGFGAAPVNLFETQ